MWKDLGEVEGHAHISLRCIVSDTVVDSARHHLLTVLSSSCRGARILRDIWCFVCVSHREKSRSIDGFSVTGHSPLDD